MNQNHPRPDRLGYLPALTGLRGITALWVLLFHLWSTAHDDGRWPLLFPLQNGWAGVDLFFILSGFVVSEAYGSRLAQPGKASLRAYARARIVRIYPVSTASLGCVVLLYSADRAFADWYATYAPGNLGIPAFFATLALSTRWVPVAGNWNEPIWSLSVEMVGYAAFPLLAPLMARTRSASIMTMAAFLLLLGTAGALMNAGTFGLCALDQRSALLRMAGGFGSGLLLHRAAVLAPPCWRRAAPTVGIAAVALVLIFALLPLGGGLMPFAFASLVLSLAWTDGPLVRFLCTAPMQTLGRLSFPLYLIHVTPIMMVSFHLGRNPAVSPLAWTAALVATIVGCLTLAALIHRFIERPAHRASRDSAARDQVARQLCPG